ncbi:hypothetical protein CYLTODRAFT_295362 [Cylindrobasidium torrendii FP15055 ss-10]|uniref:Uncharacterized protein n=1 Tax=Cylindrobasidium torrendii FP15055 ss-10 TaxID=1314674 RepID=A0A0D7BCU7_9AGAR|nr:hypothetical protein CYLTODRAFT_295362 [Cylindrobasidium torrendii FP15055 ss-10]
MRFSSGHGSGTEDASNSVLSISSDSLSPTQPDVVKQIRSQIMDLRTELDARRTAFEASVAPLEARLKQYQSMLCPCHSLPNEILGEIFKFVPTLRSPREYPFAVDIHPKSSDFPWNISKVCRRWRIICISSPTLWNSVALLGMGRFTSGTSSILSTVLERARTSPSLDIQLDLTYFSREYISTMKEYIPRITRLHVEGTAKKFARLPTALPLSNLRELTVKFTALPWGLGDNNSDDEDAGAQWEDAPLNFMPILRQFQDCPKLRNLVLDVVTGSHRSHDFVAEQRECTGYIIRKLHKPRETFVRWVWVLAGPP